MITCLCLSESLQLYSFNAMLDVFRIVFEVHSSVDFLNHKHLYEKKTKPI